MVRKESRKIFNMIQFELPSITQYVKIQSSHKTALLLSAHESLQNEFLSIQYFYLSPSLTYHHMMWWTLMLYLGLTLHEIATMYEMQALPQP